MLSISREQFRKIYAGTSVIDAEETFYTTPETDIAIMSDYMPSKLWRLNNLYTIVDKFGNKIRFKMNLSQHKVYAASLKHKRLIILKSRQQGISTLWLVSFFDDLITHSNFSIGLMAQGQDEAATLLERTKILWDELDDSVKSYFKLSVASDNTKAFALNNGSQFFVRTSFRSATLQRLHISEMGKIANKYPEKAKETKKGTLQAIAPGNTAVIESTAEGSNLYKDMWDTAVRYADQLSDKDFYPVFLSWIDDPDCVSDRDQHITEKQAKYFEKLEEELGITLSQQQKNFWVIQYRELGEGIYQEYPSTPIEAFMATKDGSYYAHLYLQYIKKLGREKTDLYDPNLDVELVFDLGMNDTNVMAASQPYNDSVRIFDELYDHGQPISYYTDIIKEKPYFNNITKIVLPHDAAVKEMTSGLTRKEAFELELPGIYIEVLPKVSIREGIEAVRQLLKITWIDPKKCPYLIDCLINYSKEWDERFSRWRDKPNHDEYSNGADCLRYLALGGSRTGKSRMSSTPRKPRSYSHDV